MNLQDSKIKASRTKTAWKSAENSKKTAEKSVNLRANFDKNKKASRIKALREFTMKRLTDFFGEKGWKTGEMGYNENRKRSKYCCWTVPMSDWNSDISKHRSLDRKRLHRIYERLKQAILVLKNSIMSCITPYLREMIYFCWIYCFCMNISNASAHKELGYF